MTAVQDLWNVESFRSALRMLLTAPADVLEELAALEDLELAPERVPPDTAASDWRRALAALKTLYRIAREEGQDAVVADVASSLRSSPDADAAPPRLDMLPRLIAPRTAFERRQAYLTARTMALPQVTDVRVTVDFHLVDVPLTSDSSSPELVPVLSARLDFDEHIFGSDSLTVALTEDSFRKLRAQINGLAAKYAHVAAALPAGLLSPDAALKFEGESE